MATVMSTDGSEDVSDFLKRIKEMGGDKSSEEEEKTKKLEEEIIAGRKEREARRLERARSLSPEKSPGSGHPLRPPRTDTPKLRPKPTLSPASSRLSQPEPEITPNKISKVEKEVEVTEGNSRPATLSWQQRGGSVRGVRSRPLSVVEPNAAVSVKTDLSRDEIAAKLSSKDPSYFKQTADRGVGSAAFRKQDSSAEFFDGQKPARWKLEGIIGSANDPRGAESSATQPQSMDDHDTSLKKTASNEELAIQREEATELTRAVPSNTLDAAKHPSLANGNPLRANQVSSSSASTRFESRPRSPDKLQQTLVRGGGGFVQSAMLKRSDSINKRWSAQNLANANRDSVKIIKDDSVPLEEKQDGDEDPVVDSISHDTGNEEPGDILSKPSRQSYHQTSKSTAPQTDEKASDLTSPPSPSKRWSPTKASWLESALNKPELPKPKTQPAPPPWMADLQKNRLSRQTDAKGVGNETETSQSTDQQTEGPLAPKSETPQARSRPDTLGGSLVENRGVSKSPLETAARDVATTKVKPATPPKKDVTSKIQSQSQNENRPKSEQLEFQNVFGKLKRTQTERFVAPNELKDNILRGKAALANTGGPQKSVIKDEFRESLVEKKAAMNAAAETTGSTLKREPRPESKPATTVPEALARRKTLSSTKRVPDRNSRDTSDEVMTSTGFSEKSETIITKPSTVVASSAEQPKPKEPLATKTLADKFNPSLANIIARGPRSAPGNYERGTLESQAAPLTANNSGKEEVPPGISAPLEHMTKNRARGPKRRLPQTKTINSAAESSQSSPSAAPTATPDLEPQTPIRSASTPPRPLPTSNILQTQHDKPSPSIPSKPSKPSGLRTASNTSLDGVRDERPLAVNEPMNAQMTPKHQEDKNIKIESAPSTKPKPFVLSMDKVGRQNPSNAPSTRSPTVGNARLPMSPPPEPAVGQVRSSPKPAPTPPSASSKPAVDNPPTLTRQGSASSATGLRAPVQHTSEAIQVLQEFFGEVPQASSNLEVDTSAIVSSASRPIIKIKTLRKQISEITRDGKSLPLPAQHEHVLYSNCMYVCSHVFGDESGAKNTEIYMWVGNGVSDSIVEETQLFAKRFARENGGVLLVMKQGKETPNFFQALGGIVITRRGSSQSHANSYLLCGRRHLGHIAFDEVDFSLASFGTGFPFIMVSKANKIYLWKGAGCNAEELGCARLIGMDLASSSELIEVDEGKEDAAFFANFNGPPPIPRSADHWKLKPRHNNYKTRLFQIEHRRPSSAATAVSAMWQYMRKQPESPRAQSPSGRQVQVMEISPFCQEDVEPENVYVLDAFFEVYIILGPLAQNKPDAFAAALLFAQDYGILAASMEDRPYVPVSTVVVEGAPRDMKAVFRKWEDGKVDTASLMAGRRKGATTLRVLPLSAAIAAIKGRP